METERQNLTLVVVLLGAGFLMMFGFIFLLLISFMGIEADLSGGERIGVIEIIGPIEDSQQTLEALHTFATDDDIKAIVLRIDSPGGAVAPSQEIYSEVFKLRGVKPVVTSMGSLAASGGYYIGCAADYVFASPGTLTGSIGVILQTTYLEEMFKVLKIEFNTYKSGKHKDTLSPMRRMTEQDDQLIQSLLMDVYDQFLSAVATARGLDKDVVRPIADGRILSGRQAKEHQLVDEMGSFRDAVTYAAKQANMEKDPKLAYPKKETLGYIEKLFESAVSGVRGELWTMLRGGLRFRSEP